MDRDETVRISRLAIANSLSINDVSKLLIDYCTIDHNKSIKDTNILISILLRNQGLLFPYVQEALDYYKRKFTICELWKDNTLLQIF